MFVMTLAGYSQCRAAIAENAVINNQKNCAHEAGLSTSTNSTRAVEKTLEKNMPPLDQLHTVALDLPQSKLLRSASEARMSRQGRAKSSVARL